MTVEEYRAEPGDWTSVEQAGQPIEIAPGFSLGTTASAVAACILELRARVEALEAKHETMRLAVLEWGKDVEKLQRWSDGHVKRIMALEAAVGDQPEPPAPEPTVWSAINAMADRIAAMETAISNACVALSQPEPVGPSDEEVQ